MAVDCLKFGDMDYIVKNEDSVNKLMGLLGKIRAQHAEIKKQKCRVWIKSLALVGVVISAALILNAIL